VDDHLRAVEIEVGDDGAVHGGIDRSGTSVRMYLYNG
jgi:hypothetical protein